MVMDVVEGPGESQAPRGSIEKAPVMLGCGCSVIPGHDQGGRFVTCERHGGRWNVTAHTEIRVTYICTPCPPGLFE